MPKNKLQDLRNHLFETLERLKDDENPMEVGRAKAVADVARVIIESAKAELQFLELTGQEPESGFMSLAEATPRRPALAEVGRTQLREALPSSKQRIEKREDAEESS